MILSLLRTKGKTIKVKELALDREKPYRTEIFGSRSLSSGCEQFNLRIKRGFRHQIRAHLAWLGRPILNDSLYEGISYGKGLLALRAVSLSFNDPSSERELCCSIPPLELDDL